MANERLTFQLEDVDPSVRLARLWSRHTALTEQQQQLTAEKAGLEELLESQLELGAEIIAHAEPETDGHHRLRWEVRQETREKLHDIENGLKLLHRWKVKIRARIEEIEFEGSARSQQLNGTTPLRLVQKAPLAGRAIPSRSTERIRL